MSRQEVGIAHVKGVRAWTQCSAGVQVWQAEGSIPKHSTAQHKVQMKMDSIYGDAGASLAQHRNIDVCMTEHEPLLPEGISQCPLVASSHPGNQTDLLNVFLTGGLTHLETHLQSVNTFTIMCTMCFDGFGVLMLL